ncbi:hypothetical protein LV716_06860 [Flagellimonas sp. HMM57]|uniref:DUF6973 domain-containing protein n=1 Tax=unclassified Flagellimonas TaxID=2644544 RepID=UPI0013D21BD2|nr:MULTISPECIES: hypothetical protein [unclassified Flagellimonas]UII77483.1 hypothetical protein LV716_06860 [Flagellimonas sp. HMM57]
MNAIRAFKQLDSKSIGILVKLCFRFPLFVFPTLSATRKCMSVSTQHYGRAHYENGPANAFRHALWNYLIAKSCYRWSKNKIRVLSWSEKITDWHEHAFPNRKLAKNMDLHNNEIGRYIFKKHPNKTILEVIEIFREMTATSSKVDATSNFATFKNKLVHITDER